MQTATTVSDPTDLRGRILRYLADRTVIALATTGPAGLCSSPVLYVNEGTRLYFTSIATTRHGQNIEATGFVVGSISDECRRFREMKGLQIEGTVERVDSVEERRRVLLAYLCKFPFGAGLWPDQIDPEEIARDPGIHAFYRIMPTSLLFTDNENSPGRREQLTVR